ncbi:MAG: hypothetical protein HOK63_06305 [Thaumarchaeota archaeon]|nr:hypothetical protein [Nitrososphaerota archaeon]MBT5843227.1 hypothetical protein [Nitrososphaerota archaeon]MBT6469241.1 hypothetical protein [Nitrososphaerota archaeon]
MDKYLMVVFVFMIVGIPIAFVSPSTGDLRPEPYLPLFYGSIAGIIIIVFYSSYKDKQERQKANTKRRKSKK